jgi:DNA polymerase sigma
VDIFGSLASGVSLPNSDIDILLSPRVAVQIDEYFLSDLAHELSLFGWVTHCDAILTAKIPVIKLIVDPFVCATNPESQFRHYTYEQQLSTPFLIKFDITLNTAGPNNTGLVSSSYMQNVFSLRPRLIEAMLVVKHLLERSGLN